MCHKSNFLLGPSLEAPDIARSSHKFPYPFIYTDGAHDHLVRGIKSQRIGIGHVANLHCLRHLYWAVEQAPRATIRRVGQILPCTFPQQPQTQKKRVPTHTQRDKATKKSPRCIEIIKSFSRRLCDHHWLIGEVKSKRRVICGPGMTMCTRARR